MAEHTKEGKKIIKRWPGRALVFAKIQSTGDRFPQGFRNQKGTFART
jgi:hypothetical protein